MSIIPDENYFSKYYIEFGYFTMILKVMGGYINSVE